MLLNSCLPGDTVLISQKCMRCKESVDIEYVEGISSTGKPIMKGHCPLCNGVNLRRLPYTSENPSEEPGETVDTVADTPSEDIPQPSENPSEVEGVQHGTAEDTPSENPPDVVEDTERFPEENPEDILSNNPSEDSEDTEEKEGTLLPVVVVLVISLIATLIMLYLASKKSE